MMLSSCLAGCVIVMHLGADVGAFDAAVVAVADTRKSATDKAPAVLTVPPPESMDAGPTPTQQWLRAADDAFIMVSVILVVFMLVWWTVASRRDPLAGVPRRANTLREDAVALAILVYLVSALILGGASRLILGEPDETLQMLINGTGAQVAGAAACLAIAHHRFTGGIKRFCLGRIHRERGLSITLIVVFSVTAIGLCPLVSEATGYIVNLLAPGYAFPLHPTIEALRQDQQPIALVVALWFGAALVAPVAEEFFFRGLLQTLLVTLIPSRWTAILMSSLLFGLIHFGQPQAVLPLVVLALLLGYAYERTGSLVVPIAIHALFNGKTLIWEALGT